MQNAVNLTSKLLEDAREMQDSGHGMEINILVSCGKLEKFALNYASLHMRLQNDSETKLSMEQHEIGKALKIKAITIHLFTKITQIHNYNTKLAAQQS